MIKQTLQSKARQGIKDDSSLHEFEREVRRRREALGLPPVDNDFDPKEIIAEWHREQELTPPSARRFCKKTPAPIREFAILIAPALEHGYLAYCPAVNGKRLRGETVVETRKKMTHYLVSHFQKQTVLPKANGRIEKVQIAIPQP